jgi:hypothetical protein
VSNLKMDDGTVITDHHQRAGKFLDSYKNRMAHTVGINMCFDLRRL